MDDPEPNAKRIKLDLEEGKDEYFNQGSNEVQEESESDQGLEEEDVESVSDSEDTQKSSGRTPRRQCRLCRKMTDIKDMKRVKAKTEKQLIIIAFALGADYKHEFMKVNEIFVCHSHYEEIPSKICDSLQIKDLSEIDSCPSKVTQEFMRTVNSLFPQLSFEQFLFDLHFFAKRNRRLMSEAVRVEVVAAPKNKSEGNEKSLRCKICTKITDRKDLKSVKVTTEKQLLMIGRAIKEKTVDDKEFMNEGTQKPVCYFHFEEILNDICNALQITNLYQLDSCSTSSIEEFMKTVNSLFPELIFEQVSNELRSYALRNQHKFNEISYSREELSLPSLKNAHKKIMIKKTCSVCRKVTGIKDLKILTEKAKKQLIVIASILRGDSIDKDDFLDDHLQKYVCHSHFEETLAEICRALHIENVSQIGSCAQKWIREFMKTVTSIFPSLSFLCVVVHIQVFSLSCKNLMREVSDPEN